MNNIFLVQCHYDEQNYISPTLKAFKHKIKAVEFINICNKEIYRIQQELKQFELTYQNELDNINNIIKQLLQTGKRKQAVLYKRDRRIEIIEMRMNIKSSHKYDKYYIYNVDSLYLYEINSIELE